MEIFSLVLGIIAIINVIISLFAYGVSAPLGIIVGVLSLVIALSKRKEVQEFKVINCSIVLSCIAITFGTIVIAIYLNTNTKLFFDFLINLFNGVIH